MGDELQHENSRESDPLEPPLSPLADSLVIPPASHSSEPTKATDVPNGCLSPEQASAAVRPHLAAAESRVSGALQQVMKSIESRLLDALKQAAIDIIQHLGREAATCVVVSERKMAVLEQQHNNTKQQALAMLLRLKENSDAQMMEADKKILMERRRAQDAEAKLFTSQELIKRLKLELKRKGEQIEELQRNLHLADSEQGVQVSLSEGLDTRKKGSRSKCAAGVKHSRQTVITQSETVAPTMLMGLNPCSNGVSQVVESQSLNLSTLAARNELPYDVHCLGRNVTARSAGVVLPTESPDAEVENMLCVDGDKVRAEQSNKHEEKEPHMSENTSVREVNNEGCTVDGLPSVSTTSCSDFQEGNVSPASLHHDEQPSQKMDSELQSTTKESDEDKSCVTVEALHCSERYLPVQAQLVEEYQSNVNQTKMDQQMYNSKVNSDVEKQSSVQQEEGDIVHSSLVNQEQSETNQSGDRAQESTPGEVGRSSKPHLHEGANCSVSVKNQGASRDDTGTIPLKEPPQEFEMSHVVCDSGGNNMETGEAFAQHYDERSFEKISESSNLDGCVASSSAVNPVSNHNGNNLPGKDAYRPQAQSNDGSSQTLRRKRKLVAVVPKYHDFSSGKGGDTTSRMDEEHAATGTFDQLLAAAGVDAGISSRDSRRLMQGARQLFSLADRKWSR